MGHRQVPPQLPCGWAVLGLAAVVGQTALPPTSRCTVKNTKWASCRTPAGHRKPNAIHHAKNTTQGKGARPPWKNAPHPRCALAGIRANRSRTQAAATACFARPLLRAGLATRHQRVGSRCPTRANMLAPRSRRGAHACCLTHSHAPRALPNACSPSCKRNPPYVPRIPVASL